MRSRRGSGRPDDTQSELSKRQRKRRNRTTNDEVIGRNVSYRRTLLSYPYLGYPHRGLNALQFSTWVNLTTLKYIHLPFTPTWVTSTVNLTHFIVAASLRLHAITGCYIQQTPVAGPSRQILWPTEPVILHFDNSAIAAPSG